MKNHPAFSLFISLFILLSFSHLSFGLTEAWVNPTITIQGLCNNQSAPFPNLDSALQTCHNTQGDITIYLTPGNYPGPSNQQLRLSAGGVVTIQAVGGMAVISLDQIFTNVGSNTNLILSNIQFNGGGPNPDGSVLSINGAYIVATNVIFNGASGSPFGGAVYISGSLQSTFTDCQFIGCKATGAVNYGGAVALINATASFQNTIFDSCTAQQGGAVYIENEESLSSFNPTVTFTGCNFTNNAVDASTAGRDASLGGGAVNVFAFVPSNTSNLPPVTFQNCQFVGNSAMASQGGSIFMGAYTGATISKCEFRDSVSFMGGAIYGSNAVILNVDGTHFINNSATHVESETSGKGGSIYLKSSFITVVDSFFTNNTASETGGAIQIVGGKSHVNELGADFSNFTNCVFQYNIALYTGGALQAEYLNSYVNVQSSQFLYNQVVGRGSLTVGQGAGGGAIFTSVANLAIGLDDSLTVFENNEAIMGMGGAIYSLIPEGVIVGPNNPRAPAINNAVFEGNIASTGGAICIDGLGDNMGGFVFRRTRFSSNHADGTNPDLPGNGGAVMSYNTTFVLSSCEIFNNQARLQGGGLWAGGPVPSFPHVVNSTFAGNFASQNVTLSSGAAFFGQTHAVFINTHMNTPIESLSQVDLYIGDNAIVQISANPYNDGTDPNTPCQFFGFYATDNSYLIFNCTPTVSLAFLDKAANVSLNQATRMIINNQLSWNGGGFACNANGGIVHFVNPSSLLKDHGQLTNNYPKFLQKCNFANTGPLIVSHFNSNSPIDLEFSQGAEFLNYGSVQMIGAVNFHTSESTFFTNQGQLLIESTLSLTGTSFGYSSPSTDNLLFISLLEQNAPINLTDSTAVESATTSRTTNPSPYTAFTLTGTFSPSGILQVNFPDLYKGLKWPDLITFNSRSSKFTVHRGVVPNNKGKLVGLHLKPQYSDASLGFHISSTASLLTGSQVFGIIFGVLLLVSLIAFGAYFYYRKNHGGVEYHGEVYETIDRPVYGTA